MKRIYLLLALVAVLGTAVYVLNPSDERVGSHLVEDRDFKVAEISSVSKVFIADRAGNTTTLVRGENDNWVYNDKFPANKNVMDNLLDAVERIEMQHIPSRAAVPSIISNLASEGLLIQLFDAAGTKLKGYYVGGATADERGTYAILEEAEQPYVVHIPGWVGNLRFRFSKRADEWRSRRLLAEDIENLSLVSVEYPTQRNESFVLERDGEGYMLGPFYQTDQPRRLIARGRAEQYLVSFEKLYVSAYSNHATAEKTELINRIPFAIIRLARKDGTEKAIKVFPRDDERNAAVDPNTDAIASELSEAGYNLLFNGDDDFGVIATETLKPFLRSYAHF